MKEKLAVQSSIRSLFTIVSYSKNHNRVFQLATKKSEKVATPPVTMELGDLKQQHENLFVNYADVSSQHNKANILDPRDRVT